MSGELYTIGSDDELNVLRLFVHPLRREHKFLSSHSYNGLRVVRLQSGSIPGRHTILKIEFRVISRIKLKLPIR